MPLVKILKMVKIHPVDVICHGQIAAAERPNQAALIRPKHGDMACFACMTMPTNPLTSCKFMPKCLSSHICNIAEVCADLSNSATK